MKYVNCDQGKEKIVNFAQYILDINLYVLNCVWYISCINFYVLNCALYISGIHFNLVYCALQTIFKLYYLYDSLLAVLRRHSEEAKYQGLSMSSENCFVVLLKWKNVMKNAKVYMFC